MSIKSEAYKLCKSVTKSPDREKIRSILKDLETVPDTGANTEKDRSNFGYIARQYRKQFLGYIIMDEDREDIINRKYPIPLPPIQDSERHILQNAHKQFLLLNRRCLSILEKNLPYTVRAVNPYNEYQVKLTQEAIKPTILSPNEIDKFSENFQKHPAFENVIKSAALLPKRIPEVEYPTHIVRLTHGFENPDDDKNFNKTMASIDFVQGKDSPVRMVFRHFAALVCIRSSLNILNQMIFQAILEDRPPLLSENNIIELKSKSEGVYKGETFTLIYQPDEKAGPILESGTLVFVDYPIGRGHIKDLFRIEEGQYTYSQDYGETATITVKKIDDNLNPFGSILQI